MWRSRKIDQLFGPSVAAGIIEPADLAGYRNRPVFINRSMHVPPPREAVRDCMPALFDLLESEAEGSVRVVLGHFIFVYIHPYFDGNGRMGRFLMNVVLASGGYPWTIILIERRDDYIAALETASVRQNIKPFSESLANWCRPAARRACRHSPTGIVNLPPQGRKRAVLARSIRPPFRLLR